MGRVLRLAVPFVVVSVLAWTGSAAQTPKAPATKMGQGTVTQATAAKIASGVVKARAADSLTLNADDGKDWTFVIDSSTKVTGKGTGAKASTAAAARKTAIMDVVTLGDLVSVNYVDKDGKMHAASVRVTTKYEDRFR